jgi:hypothetical protein
MSSCRFGGMLNIRSAICRVASSNSGFFTPMTEPPAVDELIKHIPESYLIAIGKVCIAWGTLESTIDICIATLANFDLLDQRGSIITAHMSWPQKMDVLGSLVVTMQSRQPHLAAFEQVKPLLKKAQDGRNRFVHGQWGVRDGKVFKGRFTARGTPKSSIDPVQLDDIESVITDIWQAGRASLKAILQL